MKLSKIYEDFENSIVSLSLSVCIIISLLFFALLFENKLLFWVSVLFFYISLLFFIFIFLLHIKRNFNFKKVLVPVILVLGIIIVITFNQSGYRLEGAHDQGVYLENSYAFFRNIKFTIPNPLVATFPGFATSNDKVISKFPPGYSIYLSIFTSIFNIFGIFISNLILLALISALFYLIIKKLGKNYKYFLIFIIFFLLNFYSIYFSTSTYSESLQLFLLLFTIYLILNSFENEISMYIAFLPLAVLLIVRAESLLNLGIFIAIFIFLAIKNKNPNKKKSYSKELKACILILPALIVLGFILYNLFFFNFLILNAKNVSSLVFDKTDLSSNNLGINPTLVNIYYVFNVLLPSGLLTPLILSTLFLLRNWTNTKLILPFSILLPQIIYFIKSGIAFYLPWFMRRLWPVSMIFTIFFVFFLSSSRLNKSIKLFSLFVLFILLTIPSAAIISIRETGGVDTIYSSLNKLKSDNGTIFIFVDKLNTEVYGPPIYFLHNLNIIYDRIPVADQQLYDYYLKDYKKIYLITSLSPRDKFYFLNLSLNNERLIYSSQYEKNYIKNSCDIRYYVVNQGLFNDLGVIDSICNTNNPPSLFSNETRDFYIYDITDIPLKNNEPKKEISRLIEEDLIAEQNSYKV